MYQKVLAAALLVIVAFLLAFSICQGDLLQFRLAATESVDSGQVPQQSYFGLTAWLPPDAANYSKPWMNSPYRFDTLPADVVAALGVLFPTKHVANSAGSLVVTVHGPHGGLGDRVRGVYACAMAALLTNRILLIEPSILLKQEDPQGVDASVIDTKECYKRIVSTALSSRASVRIATNCVWQDKYTQLAIDVLPGALSPKRSAAVQAMLSHCGGSLKVGDLSQSNCADYAGTGCYEIPRAYQCGPMLLHAAYATQQPEMAQLLWSVHALYSTWRTVLAPKGYNAIHFRTGHSTLHLDKSMTLPSTPWPDAEWCGERCTSWLQAGDSIAKQHKPTLPVAISSDSTIMIGLLQSRMWNSLRLLHCCAGAVHVARGGAISHEQDMSILQQNLFDLVMMGGAKRLFVDLGHFWSLGLFWWGNSTDTQVHIDRGPATTIPLLQ